MKQIGLGMRMFENEQARHMVVGGLRTLYPEYAGDVRIFTCPGTDPGTDSYELLFTGATSEALDALEREMEGIPEGSQVRLSHSRIPALIERHDCSGLGMRNVLFFDGHVMPYTPERWDAEIVPYLEH